MGSFLFILVFYSAIQSYKGDAGGDLNKLQEEFGEWRLRRVPTYATKTGNYKYNDQVESYAVERFTKDRDVCQDILNRLRAVPYASLGPKQKMAYDIFNDTLQTFVRGYEWRNYNALNPVNFLQGLHVNPARLPATTNFDTLGDYENYITRLSLIPNQIDELIQRFKKAIAMKRTYHKVSVDRVPSQIDKLLEDDDPTHFAYYKPFNDSLPKNSRISNTTKLEMKQRAKTNIVHIMDKLKILKKFIKDTYLKNTRQGYGVSSWENGEDFYRECLRWHLSLDMSPEEVHQKGLSEVERISREMRKIMNRLGHQGTVKNFFDKIKNNSTFTFKTSEEILSWYDNAIHAKVQKKLPQFFKDQDLSNLPIEVRPNPIDGIFGQYSSGTADGSKPGIFQVNVFHPTQKTYIDAMSLTLHEANPGHHLQNSVILRSDLPRYRKNQARHTFNVPFEVPTYSAYSEGWGLYSEYLGEEMGLYEDDFILMGKYSAEIFRACRLVVDTGLHYKNWTRKRAIEYLRNYTAKGINNINVEIDRYITWPGQACAYKIGELKIRDLRTKSEEELGQAFDIKEFHHVVLKDGNVPLRILEKNINQWIEDTKNSKRNAHISRQNCRPPNSASKLTKSGDPTSALLIFIFAHLYCL